ncbi:MAG: hypothetical protein JNM34_06275 [Chthonomonadaceae bacterium]|nr:hypothetical protein [Chthonomonadaceae bacterium]
MFGILAVMTVLPQARSTHMVVRLDKPLVKVSHTLFGAFFEEINQAGDGGIYGELVRDPHFRRVGAKQGWQKSKGATLLPTGELSGPAGAMAQNDGFWGINIQAGQSYIARYEVSTDGAGCQAEIRLATQEGKVLGRARLVPGAHTVLLNAKGSSSSGRLEVALLEPGSLRLKKVSLFPKGTWRGRTNGLRLDLARRLNDLRPKFLRFPGGCWVEGDTCATAYRWKTTIGPLAERRSVPNLWNYTSDNGLGYHEYLQMCEDLGAEPLFVINCGMSHRQSIPIAEMDEHVQDALDAIEYANGPADSKWGRLRESNGHREPFHLKYLEIGNENGGPDYEARYPLFVRAIKARFPSVTLIANDWGGVPKSASVEMVDEHYYNSPEFFFQNADRYDTRDRNGPKVYVGEYAVTQGCGNGNLKAALAEAAFMTGLERNGDIVSMASYAPLFANVKNKAWNPDLIYFDSYRTCVTPSYHVQKLFSSNQLAEVVESEYDRGFVQERFPSGRAGIGTWATQAEFKDVSLKVGGRETWVSTVEESGTWWRFDGAYRQTSDAEGARLWSGNLESDRYVFRCKAKKTGGREGFLVTVGLKGKGDYLWWNIGGWGNTRHAIEWAKTGTKSQVGRDVPGHVDTGQWYEIEVDYSPERVVCRLDGVAVFDERPPKMQTLYSVAGRIKSGDFVLKTVNSSRQAVDLDLVVKGGRVANTGVAIQMSSPDLLVENSLDVPNRIKPRESRIHGRRGQFRIRLPGHSFTLFRVEPRK